MCCFTLHNRFLYKKQYLNIKKIISSQLTSIMHVRTKGNIIIPREEQWTETQMNKEPQWIPKFIKVEQKKSNSDQDSEQYRKWGKERKWSPWTKSIWNVLHSVNLGNVYHNFFNFFWIEILLLFVEILSLWDNFLLLSIFFQCYVIFIIFNWYLIFSLIIHIYYLYT